MVTRKSVTILIIISLLFVGVILITRSASLTPETAQHQRAISALAPAGMNTTGATTAPENYEPIEPVSVNLADIPPGQYTPNNMYDMWLRGEIDLDERDENRASPAEIAELQAEAMKLEPNENIQIMDVESGINAPLPAGVDFDSMDTSECCGGGSVVPPDPEMAAGPNHLIAVVNLAYEIYDKTGTTLVAPTTFDSFFGVVPQCLGGFDPTILYDEEADRFAMGVDGAGAYFCMAVSASSNPVGVWHIYAVPASFSGEFHDYPHTGVGEDYIYVGANQFGGGIPGGFEGRVWALDKWDMYAGSAMAPITFSTGFEGTPQPLHLHGYLQGTWPSTGVHYFITDPFDGCTLTVWEWAPPAAPSVAATHDLCAFTGVGGGYPIDFPQLGGNPIQANDWRFRQFEYRDGHAWTTDSISCNPGGGAVDCVRWVEVNLTGSTTLVQGGVFANPSEYRSFPDLAVNQCNDMAIGYTKSTSAMYPAVWYSGRENGDPPGSVQPEAELKVGETTYVPFDPAPYRWGDYTGMTIDPDGETFWYLGEYSKDNVAATANWGTYIGSFVYASCGEPPQAKRFVTFLNGANEVPPVETTAQGKALLMTNDPETRVRYRLLGRNITDITGIHIHCAAAGVNGPVGVTLYSGAPLSAPEDVLNFIYQDTFNGPDPGNGCGWSDVGDVLTAMRSGDTYINYHTLAFPSGEIRGQIEPVIP